MIQVVLPSQLDDYTKGARELSLDLDPVHAGEVTLATVIAELDRHYPGMAFRVVDEHGNIRRHIAMFVGEGMVRELNAPVAPNDRVQIVGALSGG
jgi:molybdopterin synthase sulfur carrier subunit